MVKPGMPYLDIIRNIKDNFKIPVFAYQVSGEYSLLKNGIKNKIITNEAIFESLNSLQKSWCICCRNLFCPRNCRQDKS